MSKQKKPVSRVPTVLKEARTDRNIPVIDGPQHGFKGPEGYVSLDEYTMVGVRKDLRLRLESANAGKYSKQVWSATQLILCSRLERDFPGAAVTSFMLTKQGDIALKVEGATDSSMSTDRAFLQTRLDDACAKMAESLGV
ncbi:MAG: hypothetical protein LUC93_03205 [Planctomycetaceae bacterium]|nr:hypothetical protein [Planctomycetaceae bacterium]